MFLDLNLNVFITAVSLRLLNTPSTIFYGVCHPRKIVNFLRLPRELFLCAQLGHSSFILCFYEVIEQHFDLFVICIYDIQHYTHDNIALNILLCVVRDIDDDRDENLHRLMLRVNMKFDEEEKFSLSRFSPFSRFP